MSPSTLPAAFLEHRRAQGISGSTLEATRYWLEELALFCQGEGLERWEELMPVHLQRFHQALLWRPTRHGRLYAPNTVMQGLWAVRTFLRWAHREGYLLEDPALELQLVRPAQPARRHLTAAELESVRLRVDPSTPQGLRDAALFELLQQLPVPELLSRDVEHVQPGDSSLELSHGIRLALADLAGKALAAYLYHGRPVLAARRPEERALFLNRDGGRLSSVRVTQCLRALEKRAGLGTSLGPRRLLQSARALADDFQRPRLPF